MAAPTIASIGPPTNGTMRKTPWDSPDTQVNGLIHDDDEPASPLDSTDEKNAPAWIFIYTYSLATAFTASSIFAIFHSLHSHPLWRLPFFISTLSLFHSLEYFVTASYNPRAANTAAFILNNGRAYNIAHCLAFLECFIHYLFFSDYHFVLPKWLLALGFVFTFVGQSVRTAAMATAGSNFNHIVQSKRRSDHTLVTSGVYAYLRHPSYFGFFWWGLGTQLVLGNVICLLGYAVVLWRFFRRRIESEIFLHVRNIGFLN